MLSLVVSGFCRVLRGTQSRRSRIPKLIIRFRESRQSIVGASPSENLATLLAWFEFPHQKQYSIVFDSSSAYRSSSLNMILPSLKLGSFSFSKWFLPCSAGHAKSQI